MKILLTSSQKGGSGKTTLCRALAVAAEAKGITPVCLVDTDPQGSLTSWWNRRGKEAPMLASVPADKPGAALAALRDHGVKLAIIDTPPSAHAFLEQLLEHADLVLIPARPSPDDIDAIGATLDLVERAGKPFAFVISQAKPRSRLAADALPLLAQHGKVAPVIIHDRSEHPTASIAGLTVTETDPNGKAAAEVGELLAYVRKQIRI